MYDFLILLFIANPIVVVTYFAGMCITFGVFLGLLLSDIHDPLVLEIQYFKWMLFAIIASIFWPISILIAIGFRIYASLFG